MWVTILGLIGFLIPAGLLVFVIRRWLEPVPWKLAAALMALTLAVLGSPVVTHQSPLPLDSAASGYPFRGVVDQLSVLNSNTSETARQILPWFAATKHAFVSGRLPLWNSHSLSGHPLLGYCQAAPFSPFFLLTIFVPLPRQMLAMAALKLFTALVFGTLLVRREDVGWWPAVLGSTIFAFCLFQVVFLYYPMTSVTALLPALLYAVSRILDQQNAPSRFLLAGVTASMLLGGHPESVIHCAATAGGWIVLEVFAPRGERAWAAISRPVALAIGAGVLLSAPAWLPTLEQIPVSQRYAGLTSSTSHNTSALDRGGAALILDPDHLGHPARGTWSGRSNYAERASLYTGLIPLSILLAVTFSGRSPRRDRWLVAGWFLCILVAANWSPVGRLINAVPPLSLCANARLRFVAALLVGVLVARFADRFDRRDVPAFAFGTTVVLIGWATVSTFGAEPRPWLFGPLALLGFWPVLLLKEKPRWGKVLGGFVILLVCLELAQLYRSFHPPRDEALFAPSLPIVHALNKHADPADPFRVVGRKWTLLPDLATHYGLEDIRGVDPMAPADYIDVLDSLAPRHRRWAGVWLIRDFNQPLLDYLNIRYVLTEPGKRLPKRYEHLYSGPDGELFFNPRAVPRFFVPQELRSWSGDGLGAELQAVRNLARVTLVDNLTTKCPEPNPPAEVLSINDDGFGSIVVAVDASAPTLVASSVPSVPGWRLEINGVPSPIDRVNGAFIGFGVPKGRSEATLVYHPRSFDFGVILAILGLLILFVTMRGAVKGD